MSPDIGVVFLKKIFKACRNGYFDTIVVAEMVKKTNISLTIVNNWQYDEKDRCQVSESMSIHAPDHYAFKLINNHYNVKTLLLMKGRKNI